ENAEFNVPLDATDFHVAGDVGIVVVDMRADPPDGTVWTLDRDVDDVVAAENERLAQRERLGVLRGPEERTLREQRQLRRVLMWINVGIALIIIGIAAWRQYRRKAK